MVFDECHHGRNDHPMHQLMSIFQEYPENEHPRVIGLTGMLTSDSVKPQNVLSDLERLENVFRATIATVKGLAAYDDVLMYSTCPEEKLIIFETLPSNEVIELVENKVEEIKKIIEAWPIDHTHDRSNTSDLRANKTANPIKKLKNFWSDFVYQLKDSGNFSE